VFSLASFGLFYEIVGDPHDQEDHRDVLERETPEPAQTAGDIRSGPAQFLVQADFQSFPCLGTRQVSRVMLTGSFPAKAVQFIIG
jgi:hypothetical protein